MITLSFSVEITEVEERTCAVADQTMVHPLAEAHLTALFQQLGRVRHPLYSQAICQQKV